MDNRPIGIFDSGVGGLTVTREIIKKMPEESIVYVGDSKRAPYGQLDKETITEYATQIVNYLVGRDVKVIVIACNTVSATCVDELKKLTTIPIIEIIQPTIEIAKNYNNIGLLATHTTIESKAHEKMLGRKIIGVECPMFVPLIESGIIEGEELMKVATDYTSGLSECDAVILGCTHYPIIKDVIQKSVGGIIIDPSKKVAEVVWEYLKKNNKLGDCRTYEFGCTGDKLKFEKVMKIVFEEEYKSKEIIVG